MSRSSADSALWKEPSSPSFVQALGRCRSGTSELWLQEVPDTRNYLYTEREVPFHWDGAFAGKAPHYIVFHCDVAPEAGTGGETLFADTGVMLNLIDSETERKWRQIRITYSTEKVVHYGGQFTSEIIHRDGSHGEVIRFAEPVRDLNPVDLVIEGIGSNEETAFLSEMGMLLRDSEVCYRHQWEPGDIVIADNAVLLHARTAFRSNSGRRIRRVNVL